MASTDHTERTPFEAYVAQRRAKEQQLLSRISTALAIIEARLPEALRRRAVPIDPEAILQHITRLWAEHLDICEQCTPLLEALLYLHRQLVTVYVEQDEQLLHLHGRLRCLEDRVDATGSPAFDPDADYVTLHDTYEALHEAHEALQLEYRDLEAVYHASIRAARHSTERGEGGQ